MQQSEERRSARFPGIKVTAKSVVTINPAPAVSELSLRKPRPPFLSNRRPR